MGRASNRKRDRNHRFEMVRRSLRQAMRSYRAVSVETVQRHRRGTL